MNRDPKRMGPQTQRRQPSSSVPVVAIVVAILLVVVAGGIGLLVFLDRDAEGDLVTLDKLGASETPVSVVNTTSEGDVFRLTAPDGKVAVDDVVHVVAWGDLQNYRDGGGPVAFDWRLRIDGETMAELESLDYRRTVIPNDRGQPGQRHYWYLTMDILVRASDEMVVGSTFLISDHAPSPANDTWKALSAGPDTGLSPGVSRSRVAHPSMDVTGRPFDIVLSVQLSQADPLIEVRSWGAYATRIR